MPYLNDLIHIQKLGVCYRKAINERQTDLINIDRVSFRHSSICFCLLCV